MYRLEHARAKLTHLDYYYSVQKSLEMCRLYSKIVLIYLFMNIYIDDVERDLKYFLMKDEEKKG